MTSDKKPDARFAMIALEMTTEPELVRAETRPSTKSNKYSSQYVPSRTIVMMNGQSIGAVFDVELTWEPYAFFHVREARGAPRLMGSFCVYGSAKDLFAKDLTIILEGEWPARFDVHVNSVTVRGVILHISVVGTRVS